MTKKIKTMKFNHHKTIDTAFVKIQYACSITLFLLFSLQSMAQNHATKKQEQKSAFDNIDQMKDQAKQRRDKAGYILQNILQSKKEKQKKMESTNTRVGYTDPIHPNRLIKAAGYQWNGSTWENQTNDTIMYNKDGYIYWHVREQINGAGNWDTTYVEKHIKNAPGNYVTETMVNEDGLSFSFNGDYNVDYENNRVTASKTPVFSPQGHVYMNGQNYKYIGFPYAYNYLWEFEDINSPHPWPYYKDTTLVYDEINGLLPYDVYMMKYVQPGKRDTADYYLTLVDQFTTSGNIQTKNMQDQTIANEFYRMKGLNPWEKSSTDSTFYHPDGRRNLVYKYYENSEIINRSTYNYDAENRDAGYLNEKLLPGETVWEYVMEISKIYDIDGNMIEAHEDWYAGGPDSRRHILTYDGNELTTETTQWKLPDGTFLNWFKTEYEIPAPSQKKISTFSWNEDTDEWDLDRYSIEKYNQEDNRIYYIIRTPFTEKESINDDYGRPLAYYERDCGEFGVPCNDDYKIEWTYKANTSYPWGDPVTGSPDTHIITIPVDVSVNIEGQGLDVGDFIGLFFIDDQGNEQAGAAIEWTGVSTTLTAMGDDPATLEKDGFQGGENFGIKVYKTATGQEYTASATWDTNYPFSPGYFSANALSKITALEKCRNQFVSLCEGWNLISLNVMPSSQSMGNIFNQAGNVIVKNAAGAIQYAPEFGIVSGTWNPLEGYLVHSPTATNIEVCGDPVGPQTTINIPDNSYPYFLPYYYTHEAPATDMLAALGTNYIFAQGMECANGTTDVYNYIPEHIINPAIDEIGLMKPGLAYKIMATDAITFTYPISASAPNGGRTAGRAFTEHFIPRVASPQNAVVVFSKEALASLNLEKGDEIGVFMENEEVLLGAVVYQGEALAVTVFGTSEGKSMQYKVWRKGSGKETTLNPSYSYGTGNFAVNTVHVVSKVEDALKGETEQLDFNIYPNPSSGILNINYHADEKGEINIAMYNLQGIQMIDKRVKVSAGNNNIKSNISHFPNGLYTVIIGQDGEMIADKIIIRK